MWKSEERKKAYFKSYYKAHGETLRARRKERYQLNKEAEKRANNERYRAKCMKQYNSTKVRTNGKGHPPKRMPLHYETH